MSRHILWLALFLMLGGPAYGIQLGDTREAITGEYGQPAIVSSDGLKIGYKWAGWKLDIEFFGGVAQRMVFTKDAATITAAEEEQLLKEHGGLVNWRVVDGAVANDGGYRDWVRRTDRAHAYVYPGDHRAMNFLSKAWLDANALKGQSSTTQTKASIPSGSSSTISMAGSQPSLGPGQMFFGAILAFGLAALVHRIVLVWAGKRTGREPSGYPPVRIPSRTPGHFRSECVVEEPTADLQEGVTPRRTLNDLSWQKFELMIGELYRRRGYRVEICSGDGSDGGIDLTLRKNEMVVLVQCKHWKVYQVGVRTVREMFGVMTAERAAGVILVTGGVFTKDALKFAEGKPIDLIDGEHLRAWIEDSKYSVEGDLLDIPSWQHKFYQSAIVTTPQCPYCQSEMRVKRARKSGNQFWGCSTYPRCSGKRNIRPELMRSS